jgi:hypothetical protein
MMINPTTLAFLLVAIASMSAGSPAQEIVYERHNAVLVEQAVTVPKEQFSRDLVLRLSEEFIRKNRGKRVARLLIVTDRSDAGRFQFGKGQFHTTYHQWLQFFSTLSQQFRPQAEILQLGSSAAFRIRNGDGTIEQTSLKGSNVFRFVIRGVPLELLHVSVQPAPVSRHRFRLNLFFRAERRLGKSEMENLVPRIHALIRLPQIAISVRPDGWFIGSPDYPWANPFDGTVTPPTWEQYSGTVELYCSTTRLSCDDRAGWTVTRGVPHLKEKQELLPR